MLKRYFWLVHVLLMTLVAALGANIVKSYISATLAMPVAPKPTQAGQAPMPQTRKAFADYQVIATRNIFDANPPKAVPPQSVKQPELPTQPVQATKLRLQLMGTATGGQEQRYAIIADLSQKGTQAVYQAGDTIQNALIAEIRVKCVVLDQGGQYEQLCFEQDTEATKPPPPQPPATPPSAASRAVDSSGILQVDAATWRIGREMLTEQFGNLGSLSTQAQVVPYMVQGQPQGFRLTRLKRGSMLQQIGIQNGDVIQKVNGLSLTSPEEALLAYQQLQNEATVRLEILRRNRPTTLTYEIR
jgi:general secretion pathway protein C